MKREEKINISEEINRLIKEFNMSPSQINNGYCVEFVDALFEITGGEIYSFSEDSIYYGHDFLKFNDLFYDAETPDGVPSFEDLPFADGFVKTIVKRFFLQNIFFYDILLTGKHKGNYYRTVKKGDFMKENTKTRYFARMGSYIDCYFCQAKYKEISKSKYLYEKYIMRNECVRTDKELVFEYALLKIRFLEKSATQGMIDEMKNISSLIKEMPSSLVEKVRYKISLD